LLLLLLLLQELRVLTRWVQQIRRYVDTKKDPNAKVANATHLNRTQRYNHHHLCHPLHPHSPPPQVNRHHWNALKYFVSMTVVISSNLPASEFKVWLWAACAVAATVFSSYWDFKFDFGLGDPNYCFLRQHLSIRPRFFGTNVYYVVVVVNVFLRCSWVLSITSPGAMGITVDTELLKVCLARMHA
jgi:hypothetical protein